MSARWAIIWLAAVLAACGDSANKAPRVAAAVDSSTKSVGVPANAGSVLFAGTSLTAGLGLDPDSAYPAMVGRMMAEAGVALEAVNAGVSGETSAALLRRLDWLLRGRFAMIVVETGANDGLRGVPVSALRANVDGILGRIRAAQPDAIVALVQMEAPPNMGAEYTRAFRELYPELARVHGAHLLPFLLEGVAGVPALNQNDGIHPNLEGERKVAENIWAALRPLVELPGSRPP